MSSSLLVVSLLVGFTACHKKEIPLPFTPQALFDSLPTTTVVEASIKEASGIAASKSVVHTLWVEEDSGNPPQLYSLNVDGTVRKKVFIKGATNRDWEDITRSGDTLYVAETGDNNQIYSEYAIYKFAEPTAAVDTVYQFEKIRFQYPDGSHDAEALLVDSVTKNIYIITKRDDLSRIYKIAYPYSNNINTAVMVGQLAYSGVTSAALSPDGKEILIKTYPAIYHYNSLGQGVEATLQSTPVTLPYQMEPQGEAVCFATDNGGFFTLSEKGFASSVKLYFYKRH